jgi:glycosyltransferase involved in cell wall biosynthesis
MIWHIITGEYPPQPGGVSEYTYQIARALLSSEEDVVHLWTPTLPGLVPSVLGIEIHELPRGFGIRWLAELSRGLRRYPDPHNIIVQYVPHMYGWKSMNLSFCFWLFVQRNRKKTMVMFHEVAYPFRTGQPLKHDILATVHRIMAWIVLRSVNFVFTSTDGYQALLRRLAPPNSEVGILRICSNVPFGGSINPVSEALNEKSANPQFIVGVFSSFGSEICDLLEPVLPCVLENPLIRVVLIGPGHPFVEALTTRFPAFAGRITATGRVQALTAGPYFQHCNVLLQLFPDGACAARGTLIAALASGVPVVSTCGPLTDRLLLESGALLFAENSPERICSAIESLRLDPALARRIGDRACWLYEEHFHSKKIANTLRLFS